MQIRHLTLFLLCCCFGLNANAQELGIKSVQLYPKGNILAEPIVNINGGSPLVMKFDVLGEEAPSLSYKIIHCDYDWQPSRLSPLEYLDGFATGILNDYEFSFDTEQLYTHYSFEIPNRDIKPKISGNYKLVVYESSVSEPLIAQRFMVTEQSVTVTGSVDNTVNARNRKTAHQLDFTVDYKGLSASFPREEFKVVVYQNGSLENVLADIKPARYADEKLYYNNPFKQIFPAGNEFRWFNTRSIRHLGETIAEVIEKDDGIHVYLIPGRARKSYKYRNYNDLNGRFIIKHQEGRNDDLDAEYVTVHFYLLEDEALKNKDIYVYGGLTDWKIKEEAKLSYNARHKMLEAVLYLKQGNYDYQFVTLDNGKIDPSPIEGNFYRTENEYNVLVYYTPFNARYTRLVGYARFDSRFD